MDALEFIGKIISGICIVSAFCALLYAALADVVAEVAIKIRSSRAKRRHGFTCPICCGVGSIIIDGDTDNPDREIACPSCHGSAAVTLKGWILLRLARLKIMLGRLQK